MGVTEVKRDDFRPGIAQNVVQLESALTEMNCKREKNGVDGDEEPLSKQRFHGIVAEAERWVFVECMMHEDETVSFRMSWLSESLNYDGYWGRCQRDFHEDRMGLVTGGGRDYNTRQLFQERNKVTRSNKMITW